MEANLLAMRKRKSISLKLIGIDRKPAVEVELKSYPIEEVMLFFLYKRKLKLM